MEHNSKCKKKSKDRNANIKDLFDPKYPFVIHWDGKILPDIIGKKKVERLPILVSSNGREKLLGVSKLTAGTGKNTSDAVFDTMEQWNVTKNVRGMSFDITTSKTDAKEERTLSSKQRQGVIFYGLLVIITRLK